MQLPLQPRRSQVFFRPIAPCRRSDHLPEKLSSAKRASVQFTDKFVVRAGRDGECCSHALSSGHAGHAATFPQVTAPSTDLSGALETGSTPLIITNHMCCGGSTNTSPPPPSLSYPRRASWSRDLGGNRPFNSVPHIVHVTQARMHEPAKALLAKMSQGCHRRWALPHRAGRAQDALPGHPRTGPQRHGQARWTMPWKPALNAFAVTFADRNAGRREPVPHERQKHR